MVQRETSGQSTPDPPRSHPLLKPEFSIKREEDEKEKRGSERERKKKHRIIGIKKKRGREREREEEKKRKRSRWTPDIERGCRVGSVRRVIDIRIFGRTAIFFLLVLFFFFFPLSFSIPLPGGGLRHQPNPLPTPFGAPLTSAGFLSSLHRNSYSPSRRRSINILISRCCGI